MQATTINTLGQLKASGYQPKSVRQEMRDNLVQALKEKRNVFQGIMGFEDTVIPDLERAILSQHHILLLGLRGQAKTRIARLLTALLDEYIPVIEGSELNDDPMDPISFYGKQQVKEYGDQTPVVWMHRSERYVEKLATPDVTVADLIGDVDPIKAANLKLSYADERVIHFGLVPRAHRSLFVINELPDLQARIQVSLFNILQEGDLQIRGFKLRLPVDVSFVFTANPEDYTNRGSIITPLKDRIESQILTHYPRAIETAVAITRQEARLTQEQRTQVHVPEQLHVLLERIAFVARESEYIDHKSGVSARLSIAAYENLVSTAERRMLVNGEVTTTARITDFWGVIPAITGKVELVYEGEQEGPYQVAMHLMNDAIKQEFLQWFPNPETLRRADAKDPYGVIKAYFSSGQHTDLLNDASDKDYQQALNEVAGLEKLVYSHIKTSEKELWYYKELVLHGLAAFEVLNKSIIERVTRFRDLLADIDLNESDGFA